MEHQRVAKPVQKEQSKTSPSSLHQTSLHRGGVHPLLELQRTIGNQAVLNLLHAQNAHRDEATQAFRAPRFSHDFSRIPIHSTQTVVPQTKLQVNQPGDTYELEADQVAEQVMRMTDPKTSVSDNEDQAENSLMRKHSAEAGTTGTLSAPPVVHTVLSGGRGLPLDTATRAFMEPRFGHDFSQVRVHTDERAEGSARALHALAYTVGRDVVFGRGQYTPETSVGKKLLAHELTHVVQQTGGARVKESPQQYMGRTQGKETEPPFATNAITVEIRQQAGLIPDIQRVVELRPPGAGEQSAFGRAGELIDRLNAQSAAIKYRLDVDGRTLKYDIIDEPTLTYFDRQMRGFIDRAEVIPMRLITRAGLVTGPGGGFQPLTADSFIAAYVDIDDLLAADDHVFQSLLVHFLTERFHVRNYARRIGMTGSLAPLFAKAHMAGFNAQAALLQDILKDPSIRFNYEELKPDGTTAVQAFKSHDHGYRVFQVFRGHGSRQVVLTEMYVLTADNRRLTIDEFQAERAAAAPAP